MRLVHTQESWLALRAWLACKAHSAPPACLLSSFPAASAPAAIQSAVYHAHAQTLALTHARACAHACTQARADDPAAAHPHASGVCLSIQAEVSEVAVLHVLYRSF